MSTHCVEAAFVDFIQDYNTVVREHRICQDLPQQAAVCHVLHHRVLAQTQPHPHVFTHSRTLGFIQGMSLFASHLWCAVIEAYLVANLSTQSALHLLGDPLCHRDGSHPPRLRDSDFAIFTKTYTKRIESGSQWKCHVCILNWENSNTRRRRRRQENSSYPPDIDTGEAVWFSRCQSHRWPPETGCVWRPGPAWLCAGRSAGVLTRFLLSPIYLIWT